MLAVAIPAGAENQMEEIIVVGSRSEQQLGDVPMAVSLVKLRDIQQGRQELGLDESLSRVPGLFMQNRYNFAQDLRVSIRGFGSRASFGIRGIQVFADGLPVTLPDGQSGTDDLDIGSAESIEVIRGPSASLYGTAAGGVISLTTEAPPEEAFVEGSVTAGEFGHRKYQIKTGGQTGRLGYLVNASYLEMDGFRDYSRVEHKLINSKFRYEIDDTSDLTAIVNLVDSPEAEDPGGITRDEAAENRSQAQPRNTS
ncbi:MAG: TonB-dependent receptor plug domain-containing protein, partial [Gammaproteobacteria bacterium]|nr:TonB-dependent receptor plug domain-containing protein [Gammaproteobacteria bacterium]